MDFEFRETERDTSICHVEYAAFRGGAEIGRFGLYHYNYDAPEFYIWATGEGRAQADYDEYVDAALDFLKTLGCSGLYLVTTDDDLGDWHGFTLADRDASGWEPKYIFYRELTPASTAD